jgi:hypothetical protein
MMRTYVGHENQWNEAHQDDTEKSRAGWRTANGTSQAWPVTILIDTPKLMLVEDPIGYVLFIDDELIDGS